MALKKNAHKWQCRNEKNTTGKAKGKAEAKSTLFNLSAYGKQYFDEDGNFYGFRLAGTRKTGRNTATSGSKEKIFPLRNFPAVMGTLFASNSWKFPRTLRRKNEKVQSKSFQRR